MKNFYLKKYKEEALKELEEEDAQKQRQIAKVQALRREELAINKSKTLAPHLGGRERINSFEQPLKKLVHSICIFHLALERFNFG